MKAHRTDIVSFAFGLIFLGLAAWWLLAQLLGLALPAVGWFLAGALILIGLLGLVGALRSGRPPDTAPPRDAAPDDGPGASEPVGSASAPPEPSGPVGTDQPAEVDPTRWDLDRPAPADEPTAWGGRRSDWGEPTDWGTRPEWDVSAPTTGAPTTSGLRAGGEADEWPTEAVTDVRPEAVEDRAADEGAPQRRTDRPPADEERPRA
ncbi:hypothetical protein AB0F80_08600 [Micromonospora echinofusca]